MLGQTSLSAEAKAPMNEHDNIAVAAFPVLDPIEQKLASADEFDAQRNMTLVSVSPRLLPGGGTQVVRDSMAGRPVGGLGLRVA